MGKVRKYRRKYHLSKVEAAKAANAEEEGDEALEESGKGGKDVARSVLASNENVFAGLDISLDALTRSLPEDFDAKSVISTKSRKELKLEEQHLKKKVKQKLRRERFMNKLDVTHQAIEQDKKNKKKGRGKKSGSGVQNPFTIPLPLLKSLSAKKEKKEFKIKPKGIQKMRTRLRQQTSDVRLMSKILKDKKFMANPGQTITEYLKEKVAGTF